MSIPHNFDFHHGLLDSWTRWGLAEVLALDATELDQWLTAVAALYPAPARQKTR